MTTLLTDGNTKLGSGIGVWSIPPVKSCPGATALCKSKCYAERFIKQYGINYGPRFKLSKTDKFVERMVQEAQYRTFVRIHVAGDFYSQEYIRKWASIAGRCPGTKFYAYTRSWRDPLLLPALRALKAMPNFKLLFSCDRETGAPEHLGPDVAWMAMDDNDAPPRPVKMVFRVKHKTVMAKMGGSVVCPKENGIKNEVTCGRCRLCFK